ncbi:MAG: nascent polypeptide-associated complex protein [Thermoprotei archaeon]|nr:nascent polypeptide-associated complex protein [Thermoprotei archaeon]
MFWGLKPEEAVKMLRRLGVSIEEVNAVRVTVEVEDGSRIVIDNPTQALIVKSRDQPPIIMVMGEHKTEKPGAPEAPHYTEDDVRLVAEQAGVSLEEARRALEETGGDIAAAIVRLAERRAS